MTATLKYQTWSAGNFDWASSNSTTGSGYAVYNELSAWVTAVNLNAGMSGRQIVEVYDPTQATTPGTDFGFVFNLKQADNSNYFFQNYVSGTTINFNQGDTHTTGTANGGFGTLTAPTSPDAPTVHNFGYIPANNAAATSMFIAYSTVDTEEFFLATVYDGNGGFDNNFFAIAKDLNGEWLSYGYGGSIWGGAGVTSDGELVDMGQSNHDNSHLASNSFVTIPITYQVNNYTTQTGPIYDAFFSTASPFLGTCNTASYDAGGYIVDGSDAWVNTTGGYGPWVKYTPS